MTTPPQVEHILFGLPKIVDALLKALVLESIPTGATAENEIWPSVHMVVELIGDDGVALAPVRITLEISPNTELGQTASDLIFAQANSGALN